MWDNEYKTTSLIADELICPFCGTRFIKNIDLIRTKTGAVDSQKYSCPTCYSWYDGHEKTWIKHEKGEPQLCKK